MRIERRGFFKLSAGIAAGLAAARGRLRALGALAEATTEEPLPRGPASWKYTICRMCEGGCGLRVKIIDGKAVSVEGNPLYPVNRGGLCPKGVAALQELYDPDRVRGPLRRVGARGEGRWESITWDEAFALVTAQLAELRAAGGAHALVVVSGAERGLMPQLVARFCQAYGTPNYVRGDSRGYGSTRLAHRFTQGIDDQIAYDFERSRYVLSFAAPLLDSWHAPVRFMRAYGELRQGRPGGARIIQIEPRFSMTAARADRWIPVAPGFEGALALGIAYVLIKEGLYDREFVDRHTFGFDDWTDATGRPRMGFRTLVMREYHVDAVSRLTDVLVATIVRLAKEFAENRPQVAVGASTASNAVYTLMAVHALNALVGSIDVAGGVVVPDLVPLAPLEPVVPDPIATRSLAMGRLDRAGTPQLPFATGAAARLAEALESGAPYAARALILHEANPMFAALDVARLRRALASVPFVVSLSPVLDESSLFADLVLPDHTFLERWQVDAMAPVAPYTVLGVGAPAVGALYDTRDSVDVLLEIARRLGSPVAAALPWAGHEQAIRASVEGIVAARRGSIIEAFEHEPWTRLLEERGWWYPTYRTADELWQQLLESGGWWDPAYFHGEWPRVFRTPSGRFEFFASQMHAGLMGLAREQAERWGTDAEKEIESVLARLGIEARGDKVFLPHFELPRRAGNEAEFPFLLFPYRLLALTSGRHANLPFLQEFLAPHLRERWSSWVEINPQTAARLGIADGDWVWIESPVGRVKTRARLYAGAMPQVVSMPLGQGHTAYGRWARGIGANAWELLAGEMDRLSGGPALSATRVRLTRA
jgi:anaerobic selenocysteine-containing dehydrogenase